MLTRTRLASDLAVELRKMVTVDLNAGDRLPSEKDLAEQFGVSRNTVREALLSLWESGLVIRKWGVGTFVRDSSQAISQSMSPIKGMNHLIQSSANRITLANTSVELVPCPLDAAAALSLEPGVEVWHIDRVFAFDGHPATILLDWVPTSINGRAIDATLLTDPNVGLLDLLRDSARCRIATMESEFTAELAGPELAERLEAPEGTALIAVEQVSVDSSGDIVIFSRTYHHTQISSLHLVRSIQTS
ncbi:MAG: GntR family transcriptional regulator [Rhodoglobus sp.]|nr:GntR family transcriptional regulator [Rhodoglobus sp.]